MRYWASRFAVLVMLAAWAGCDRPAPDTPASASRTPSRETLPGVDAAPSPARPAPSGDAAPPSDDAAPPSNEAAPPSDEAAPPPDEAASMTADTPMVPPADTPMTEVAATEAAMESNGKSPADLAASEPPQTAAESHETDAPPAQPRWHRILTPTSIGPLLVELQITVDGRPIDEALDRFLAERLAAADSDGNGRTQWQEWLQNAGDYAGPGGLPSDGGQRRELIRQYDTNRNGHAEADEVARLLSRDGGVTAAFSLASTHTWRNRNRTESALFQLLDHDGDAALSRAERSAAADRLRRFDQDGDDLLLPAEMAATQPASETLWRRGTSGGRSDAALALSTFSDWSMLGYALAGMQPPTTTSAAAGPFRPYDLVAQLDVGGDGTFSSDEAQTLQTVEPHLCVGIQLSATDERQMPRLRLIARNDALPEEAIAVEPAGRLTLTLPGMRWTLVVKDAPQPQQAMWMYQVRGRASEQPDALAAWLDRDQDGRLATRELQSAPQRLAEISVADDAALSPDAVPDAYQVCLIRGNPQQDAMQFAAPLAPPPAGAARSPWAAAMDANGDGDISSGEFLGSPSQFDALDVDGDGFLTAAEAT